MLRFHRLVSSQDSLFQDAFALYQASFPEHERRQPLQQSALMPHPLYHFDIILDDGVFCGILLHWALSGCCYIEHFAICTDQRGNALGSRSLSDFCARHPLVVLEIDPPIDGISIRRQGFYQRLGFHSNSFPHKHPAYQAKFPPHELVVMSYPKPLSAEEYHSFSGELSGIVMKDANPR